LSSPPPFHQFEDLPEPVDFGSFIGGDASMQKVSTVTRDAEH
jgi:hypothetical protein